MSVILCDRVLSSAFALPVSLYMQRNQKQKKHQFWEFLKTSESENPWISAHGCSYRSPMPAPPQRLQQVTAHLTTSLGRRAHSVLTLMLPASHWLTQQFSKSFFRGMEFLPTSAGSDVDTQRTWGPTPRHDRVTGWASSEHRFCQSSVGECAPSLKKASLGEKPWSVAWMSTPFMYPPRAKFYFHVVLLT